MEKVDWFIKLGCVVGAGYFSPHFLQLKAEIESHRIDKRIRALEDPISSLDPHIIDFSRFLYEKIKKNNEHIVDLEDAISSGFDKSLLVLSGGGWIDNRGALLEFNNPEYVVYMAGWSEPDAVLNDLIGYIHDCQPGVVITLKELTKSLNVPDLLVISLFKVYESKGLGLYDSTIGYESYLSKLPNI